VLILAHALAPTLAWPLAAAAGVGVGAWAAGWAGIAVAVPLCALGAAVGTVLRPTPPTVLARVLVLADPAVAGGLAALDLGGLELVEPGAPAAAGAPDVLLVDGLARLGDDRPAAPVVLRAEVSAPDALVELLRRGVVGVVHPAAPVAELGAAITTAARGGLHVPLDLLRDLRLRGAARGSLPLNPDALTAREAEVLGAVARGLSNEEIAEHLHLGVSTVKTHVNRIFAKAGARDRAQAVIYAYEQGFAAVPPPGGGDRVVDRTEG
jgi:DNA-binding NarL/FixJ family response regulator